MSDDAFTPGRDGRGAPRPPMSKNMESAVEHSPADIRARDLHLLRDCLAFGRPGRRRPPAKLRLEEALGPEFARKLLRNLSAVERRS
jgi:hypothetical protein